MNIIFVNFENRKKKSKPNRLILTLACKLNLNKSDKYVTLLNVKYHLQRGW